MRNLLPLCLVVLLAACTSDIETYDGLRGTWSPKPLTTVVGIGSQDAMKTGMPDGTDDYSRGFRDGCNTYTGIIGSGMLQSYGVYVDADAIQNNADYYEGYKFGGTYCTMYLGWEPL